VKLARDVVDGRGILDEVAASAEELDLRNLFRAGRCLDDRRARADPAIAQTIEEERAREPVLERAGGMRRLVLEIERDARDAGHRHLQEMRVGRAVEVRLDPPHRLVQPGVSARHAVQPASAAAAMPRAVRPPSCVLPADTATRDLT
jgi:hypothetical protein